MKCCGVQFGIRSARMRRFSVMVCLLIAAAVCPALGAGYRTSVGTGADAIPVVVVSGTPYEMGFSHGSLMAAEVNACVTGFLTYAQAAEPMRCSDANLDAAWATMAPYVPTRFIEEMQGVAAGSGVTYDALRRFHAIPLVADYACSMVALWGPASANGHLFQIRNLDWVKDGGLQDYPLIVVYIPQTGVAHVNIGFAGMVGSNTGMNTEGIALSEKGASPSSDYPFDLNGVHFTVLFRNILQDAHRMEQALDILTNTQRIKKYRYVIGDAGIPWGVSASPAVKVKAFAPDNILNIWTDDDPTDELFPNVLPNVVYMTMNNTAAWNNFNANYGLYTADSMIGLSRLVASPGGNLMDVVYDATMREMWVAYAEGSQDASVRPYVHFNLNDYLPLQGALIQEDFEGYQVGPGAPPGWTEFHDRPGPTWEIVDIGGNKVLKGISGPPQHSDCGVTAPYHPTGRFVENFEMQVSLRVESGSGGGIGNGENYGRLIGPNYYAVEVSVPDSGVTLFEGVPWAPDNLLGVVYFPPGTINYGQWYDVRMVSTGTTFQVWFRPHSTQPWQAGDKIIDVPQDAAHPGHKTYLAGQAGCWTQNHNGPSTVLFDDFRLEAAPFPAAEEYADNFENPSRSLANWSQDWCTLDFPFVPPSRAARIVTGDRSGGITLGQGKQYYTHDFVLRTSMYVDDAFSGGVGWGWEGTETADTDYHIEVTHSGGNITLDFDEEQNSTSGTDETQLATWTAPAPSGWYTIEVRALGGLYLVGLWTRGTSKLSGRWIWIHQDQAHPGYRLTNMGAVGLWQNPHRTAYFDDFYFYGTAAPQVNTPKSPSPGVPVTVEPEPGMEMTFANVSTGGTTSVETSTTAPGGGPGGLQFQGLYYDINTTCVYTGPVTICLSYDDTGMTPEQEASLQLLHWVTADQVWRNITTSLDTVNNVICGSADSLSVFALATFPVFNGFLQPINMPPTAMSVFKQKSTIPVKFRLLDPATGAPVPDVAATIWCQRVAGGVPNPVNEPVYATQPDGGNAFRYDPTAGQYIFNLSTKSLTTGVYRIHASIMGELMDRWVDVALK